MDNGMEGMLDTYLYETNSLLDRLDEMLVADEKVGDFSSDDVNEIFRIMHTIKGSSAMMEYATLATITHHIEDLFFYIRDKGIDSLDQSHKKELFNLMFRSEDYLRGEITKVENGEPLIENIDDFAKDINDFLKKISGAATEEEPAGTAAPGAAPAAAPADKGISLPDDPKAECFLHLFLEEGVGMENLRAYMVANAVKECGVDFRYYPSDMESNPDATQEIIDNGFFFAFDSQDVASQAVDIIKSQNHISSYELMSAAGKEEPAPEPAPAAPAPAAAPAVPASPKAAPAAPKSAPAPKASSGAPVKQSLISVNLSKLDSLMAIVGEIVITESMVTASPELQLLPRDSYDNFMKSGRQLRKLTDDLQDTAMSLRMVPISGVFQKMNRIVRDMKQNLNKDVRLTIIGEDTEVDKNIVDSIQDPIMHIVRNSMDHGIEATAAERIAAGKDPQGELILSASHTSSEVVIAVSDDGYGMDPDKLLAKAREKGILTKQIGRASCRERV